MIHRRSGMCAHCGLGGSWANHESCRTKARESGATRPIATDPPAWAVERALEWWHKTFAHHRPDGCTVNVLGKPLDLCRNDVSVTDRAECIARARREGWEAARAACRDVADESREAIDAIPYQEPK